MCFSTTASFAAGVLLSGIGIISLKKTKEPKAIPFAMIPLAFGLQQFAEGFVWLSLLQSADQDLQRWATNFFLLFALVVWPSLIPISVFLIEKQEKRKKVLKVIAFLGVGFSILAVYYLLCYPSKASIFTYHIHYDLAIPDTILAVVGVFYLLPTVISHFISSVKLVPLMGILVLLSYLISRFFFYDKVLSVWCFFSALISIMIYFILQKRQKEL